MAKRPKRRYNAPARRAAAERTRERILTVAHRRFLKRGYAATTIAAVAREARVSPESIYKTFGGKAGLIRAIREQALAGTSAVHAETRSDELQRTAREPRAIVRGWASLATEVAPRVHPLLLLVRDAAAQDAEVARLQHELDAARHRRMTGNARSLHSRRRRAADILWLYSSPEVYDLLVLRRGWSLAEYRDFIGESMISALL